MKTKKLLVLQSKKKSSSIREHKQLKDIFKEYLKIDLQVDYAVRKNLLKEVKVKNKSIVQSSVKYKGDYDWVHVRLSLTEWRKLKLKSTLWGEHQKIKGVSVTFGRWSQFSKYKRAHLFKHELGKVYEHVIGMLHEYIHGQEGSMAVAHSYLYGYDRLYTKKQAKRMKPKRYVSPSSMLKALDWVFNKSQTYKIIKEIMINIKTPEVYINKNTLRIGGRGSDVKLLQGLLGLKADGIFGRKTKRSVKLFQLKNFIYPDGIVGKNTWRKLIK